MSNSDRSDRDAKCRWCNLSAAERAALNAEVDALPPLSDEQLDIIVAIVIEISRRRGPENNADQAVTHEPCPDCSRQIPRSSTQNRPAADRDT